MKKKYAVLAVIVPLSIAVFIGAYTNAPERKAAQFVRENGAAFGKLVNSGQPVSPAFKGVRLNTWSKEHLMYEFLLGTGVGDSQYWGVYYSPDDIPLPFQNAALPLLTNGEGSWIWQAEGDNHGATKKITEKWYYFEASF